MRERWKILQKLGLGSSEEEAKQKDLCAAKYACFKDLLPVRSIILCPAVNPIYVIFPPLIKDNYLLVSVPEQIALINESEVLALQFIF